MPEPHPGARTVSAKLGLKAPMAVAALGAPADYAALVGPLPQGVLVVDAVAGDTDLVHLFATERAVLQARLATLRRTLPDAVPVWVSWPKRASKVATDITEDTVRALALPLGFVDVKVCAVSAVWSGLKLVVRRSLRAPGAGRGAAAR